jgi:predicted nucleic acid-binding protein
VRFLLDTNVLSEPIRPAPSANVAAWPRSAAAEDLAASVLSMGELQRGVLLVPAGARRERLLAWMASDLAAQLGGRVLPVDAAVTAVWARLGAAGRLAGRPLPDVDGLLLATAQVYGLTLVTRNTRHCGDRGVPTLDPWV